MNFVTGATGLVGSHLLAELCSRGEEVIALKRHDSNTQIVEKLFHHYFHDAPQKLQHIRWVEGDILDIDSLIAAMTSCEYVYHCAALVSFNPAHRQKLLTINGEGTANVVNAALHCGIKKLAYISSVAALGSTDDGSPLHEEAWWNGEKNKSGYAISKYAAEREVWRGTEEGLPATIVNPAIILGPSFSTEGSSAIINTVYQGMKFYTNGINGFVDVRDVTRAMVMLTQSPVNQQRYILSGAHLTYKELFTQIAQQLKVPVPPYRATPLMTAIAWRAEKIHALITKKPPLITKETARSAHHQSFYNSSKITKAINFSYTPIEQTIAHTCNIFLKEHKDVS